MVKFRSLAVPGHSIGLTATLFDHAGAGLVCHVAAPEDGRTPSPVLQTGREKMM